MNTKKRLNHPGVKAFLKTTQKNRPQRIVIHDKSYRFMNKIHTLYIENNMVWGEIAYLVIDDDTVYRVPSSVFQVHHKIFKKIGLSPREFIIEQELTSPKWVIVIKILKDNLLNEYEIEVYPFL